MRQLNTTMVVVLEFLFPYGYSDIWIHDYEMGPPMLESQVKES